MEQGSEKAFLRSVYLRFGPDTAEDRIAEWVEDVLCCPDAGNLIAELLPEQLPVYARRNHYEIARIRGHFLMTLEETGMPQEALPYALEALQSGQSPYLVAAAAIAVRGLPSPGPHILPFLIRGLVNMYSRDVAVSFDCYLPRWPVRRYTTARREILRTLAWIGAMAWEVLPQLEMLRNQPHQDLPPGARIELEMTIAAIRGVQGLERPLPESEVCVACARPGRSDYLAGGKV